MCGCVYIRPSAGGVCNIQEIRKIKQIEENASCGIKNVSKKARKIKPAPRPRAVPNGSHVGAEQKTQRRGIGLYE